MNSSPVTNLPGIKKLFPGFQMKEAQVDLTLPIEASHPFKFKKKDPCFCALAWATMMHNPTVKPFIFRSTAYLVDLQMHTITRYLLGVKERAMIDHFDKTGEFTPGTYTLTAPGWGSMLSSKPTGKKTPGADRSGRTRKPALTPRSAHLVLG